MRIFKSDRRVPDILVDLVDKHIHRMELLTNELKATSQGQAAATAETAKRLAAEADFGGQIASHLSELVAATREQTAALAKTQRRRAEQLGGPERPIRLAFLFQSASIWPSWKSLWDACSSDPRFIVTMVLTPFRYTDRELALLEEAKRTLIERRIPFYTAQAFSVEAFSPDVVFVQMPYADSLPPHLQLDSITAAGAKIAYIPYGLEIGGGGLNLRYQFDLPIHRNAWRIFARSERHRAMFAKYCRSGSGHVIVTGHPKFDSVAMLAPAVVKIKRKELAGERRIVMWSPHFSVQQPPAWSTFSIYSDDILYGIERLKNIHLLIRPHPLFFATMRNSGGWNEQDEDDFRRRVAKMENCSLDESEDYLVSFAISDALMADAGSFILEFFATGKPLLYLKHPDGYGLNDDGDIEAFIYSASTAGQITEFLDMVSDGIDPKADIRRAAMPEFVPFLDGKCGERIRDHIYLSIAGGDTGSAEALVRNDNHEGALQYWRNSDHTYLAPPDYYDRQEAALRSFLERLRPKSALDVGCGDGRFTRVIAEYAGRVSGIDVSPALLERAKEAPPGYAGSGAITYSLDSLEDPQTCGTYELVACMGVLSGFLDPFSLLKAVEFLAAMVRTGGSLILKETLSATADQLVRSSEYVACYRNREQYLRMFLHRGFSLVSKVELTKMPENQRINELYLLTRDAVAPSIGN